MKYEEADTEEGELSITLLVALTYPSDTVVSQTRPRRPERLRLAQSKAAEDDDDGEQSDDDLVEQEERDALHLDGGIPLGHRDGDTEETYDESDNDLHDEREDEVVYDDYKGVVPTAEAANAMIEHEKAKHPLRSDRDEISPVTSANITVTALQSVVEDKDDEDEKDDEELVTAKPDIDSIVPAPTESANLTDTTVDNNATRLSGIEEQVEEPIVEVTGPAGDDVAENLNDVGEAEGEEEVYAEDGDNDPYGVDKLVERADQVEQRMQVISRNGKNEGTGEIEGVEGDNDEEGFYEGEAAEG